MRFAICMLAALVAIAWTQSAKAQVYCHEVVVTPTVVYAPVVQYQVVQPYVCRPTVFLQPTPVRYRTHCHWPTYVPLARPGTRYHVHFVRPHMRWHVLPRVTIW